MTLDTILPGGKCWNILAMTVVFPVPALPVSAAQPFRSRMAYVKPEIASRCRSLGNIRLGSGVIENGARESPKKAKYISVTYRYWRNPKIPSSEDPSTEGREP